MTSGCHKLPENLASPLLVYDIERTITKDIWDDNQRLWSENAHLKSQRKIFKKAASILAEVRQLGMV